MIILPACWKQKTFTPFNSPPELPRGLLFKYLKKMYTELRTTQHTDRFNRAFTEQTLYVVLENYSTSVSSALNEISNHRFADYHEVHKIKKSKSTAVKLKFIEKYEKELNSLYY